MKLAFIIPFANTTYSGGIQVQGRMWRDGLVKLGHQVDLINNWDKFDWNSYDFIFIFGVGKLIIDYVRLLKAYPYPKLVSAPIIDYNAGMRKFILRSRYYGSIRLRYYKPYHDLYYCRNDFEFFLIRSEHERKFITQGYGLGEEHTRKVPISFRIEDIPTIDFTKKEDFVFHASRLTDPGKNVERLIKAAIKYDFRLVLAGSANGNESWLHSLIDGHDNIKYLGWITDEELYDNYRRAKVLALPSLVEGVGMVALEAAVYGCEIVLTNLGAPKEYWDGRAVLVDPYSVDNIGQGALEAMNTKHAQPGLQKFIVDHYGPDACCKQLEKCLLETMKQ